MVSDQSPETGAVLYSHDEMVAAITSYYKLVSSAHVMRLVPPLIYPPPEGWPQLYDPDVVRGLDCSDNALNLIRHIPYFEYPDMLQVLPKVQPTSYIEKERIEIFKSWGRSMHDGYETPEEGNRIPSHMICLGYNFPDQEYGHKFWLDTKLGNIVLGNTHCQETLIIVEDDEYEDCVYPEDGSYEWLFEGAGGKGEGIAYRASQFFAACERKLRELDWIPGIDEDDSGWIHIPNDSMEMYRLLSYEQRKQIYFDNGWPGDNWNPEKAVEDYDREYDKLPPRSDSNPDETMEGSEKAVDVDVDVDGDVQDEDEEMKDVE